MNQRPLIIFDTSVVMHELINFERDTAGEIKEHLTPSQLYERLCLGVNFYNSLHFLPGIDPKRCDILWAGDSTTGYWRKSWFQSWLDERPGFVANLKKGFEEDSDGELVPTSPTSRRNNLKIGYKANRGSCPYRSFAKLKINKISKAVVFPGYEADDVASAALRIFPRRRIILCTIDTDWLQLVDKRVSWVCLKGFTPQFRDVEGAMDWFRASIAKDTKKVQEKFKQLDSPRQIVDWKMFAGDRSDNLPKGSPREVIDLLYPPYPYRLWLDEDKREVVKASLTRGKSSKTGLKAIESLIDAGVMPSTPRLNIDWSKI